MSTIHVVFRHSDNGIDWIASAHNTKEAAGKAIEDLQLQHEDKVRRAKELLKSGKLNKASSDIWDEYDDETENEAEQQERAVRIRLRHDEIYAEADFSSWGEYDYALYFKAKFSSVELEVEG